MNESLKKMREIRQMKISALDIPRKISDDQSFNDSPIKIISPYKKTQTASGLKSL